MTNEHLAALSDAATQAMEEALALADTDLDPDKISVARCKSAAAHDRLAYALVNAYRANQIAVIGPDAVERIAAAMAISQGADAEDWEIWLPEATAAIAALTGRV